jgi:hypothetical protein
MGSFGGDDGVTRTGRTGTYEGRWSISATARYASWSHYLAAGVIGARPVDHGEIASDSASARPHSTFHQRRSGDRITFRIFPRICGVHSSHGGFLTTASKPPELPATMNIQVWLVPKHDPILPVLNSPKELRGRVW